MKLSFDKNGSNLASQPQPGWGHKALHNQLQHIVQDMIKIGSIKSVTEAVTFLINKVGQPYIGDYVNHVTSQLGHPRNAQDAIVPDLHATNYPAGNQVVYDIGASRFAKAIFEVKTFTICKT